MSATRLDPHEQGWMGSQATRAVMDALNPGGADNARFVGGCVRNALMGSPVDDVDIATVLVPEDVLRVTQAAGLKPVPTGIDHGTITVVSGGVPFEVTTLRKDVATDGRRATIAFASDWAEDAARRDFRLNAIYARPNGSLYDPYGGAQDALAGRIIFIGEAEDRIAEDYLRILRFYRFNAWYGQGEPDLRGQAACVAMREGLGRLSAERVWKELKKLLAATDPLRALGAMQEGHILEEVLPGPLDFNLLFSIIRIDQDKNREPDPLIRVAALAGAEGERVATLSTAMKVSNAERARLVAVAAPARAVPGLSAGERARHLYRAGPDAFAGQIRISEALRQGDPARTDDDLAAAARYERPRFPVAGRDLLGEGFAPGPELGQTLGALEEAWIESGFALDRTGLLARARRGGKGE